MIDNAKLGARACGSAAPVSDLQHAYLLGELGDFQLGGPALFYEEYSCPDLDLQRFSQAICLLMRRHEMLRATFDEAGLLHVHDELPTPITYRDLRGQPEPVCRKVLAANREHGYQQGPALQRHAPFDITIFALDQHYVVQMCGRLLAIDGFSGEIFAQELRALLDGETLPPLRYTFREYRHDDERRKEGEDQQRAERYWLDRIDSLPPAPELPQRRLSTDPDPRLVRRTFKLAPQQWTALEEKIRKRRLTPTMVLGTAFCEVLRHWSKNPDFTINIMYGERAPLHPDVNRLIGNFSSTVLVECAAGPPDSTFSQRARAWRRQLLQDLEHSSFSGVSVIRELNQRQGNLRNATMPVVFTSMLGVGDAGSGVFLEHLGWDRLEHRVRTPQVALDHQVFLAGNRLVTTWDSADDLYPTGVIDDMFAAYRHLLIRLASDDAAWESTSFGLTPAEQLRIRDRVNDTAAPAPTMAVHELFCQQAKQTPERTAIISSGRTLTYAQLRDQARAVATQLIASGTMPGDLVAVQAPRGTTQIAALLGVLMAGAAYVPVSPDWPRQRRQQIADLAKPRLLLASGPAAGGAVSGVEIVDICGAMARYDGADQPAVTVNSDQLAYVIFTSGTTGTPKGAMLAHGSVVNTLADINERFGLTMRDRVLGISDFTFDLSVWDVFGLLAVGGAVVVPDTGLEREVTHLYDLCQEHGVTVWNSVPAYLAMFTEFVRAGQRPPLPDLRLAMVSGDWVPINLGADVATVAPQAAVVSLGGATEASIWSNYFPVPAEVPPHWVSIPYGYPLRNQRFHILDRHLLDRPNWVPGELYIAGRGLAEGYVGRSDLTSAAFITHPRRNERLYRTGDWARYWPDGTLEFLGREDPQVKINGFRVELGEIEAALLSHPAVTDAAVVSRADGRGMSLVAFVASQVPAEKLRRPLREHVAAALPVYLVPQIIDISQRLPLTTNGKVDRRLLTERASSLSRLPEQAPADPQTDTERMLAATWRELLGSDQIGRHDDFFACGGSSLLAAQLMNIIEQQTGRRLPLAALYNASRLDQLATRLDAEYPPGAATHLVTLADNDLPPVILIHPVGGDLLCYRPLVSQLAQRHRVLGLLAGPAQPGSTIEDMAARYLSDLAGTLPHLPEGQPVRLAGWSLGGTVAYEMARRLRRDGYPCVVTMLDPWVRCSARPTPDGAALVGAFLHNLAGGPLDLDGQDRAEDPTELLRQIWGAPPPPLADIATMSVAELTALYQIFETNTLALLRYSLTTEPELPVAVLEATQGLAGPASDYLVRLREAAPSLEHARYHQIDADHFVLMAPDHAAAIASLISDGEG